MSFALRCRSCCSATLASKYAFTGQMRSADTASRISANNAALPASRRASMSVVMTPTSAALSSAHCADGAHAVADFEVDVPEEGDDAFDHAAAGVVGRGRHEDQDVDVGVRMQFAAAVAADRRERPALVAVRQLRAPHLAQDDVDELGARMHQHFDRFVGAEALGELGVRFLQFGAERVGRVSGRGEPLRQMREPQPGRAAQDRGFGRFDVLFERGHQFDAAGRLLRSPSVSTSTPVSVTRHGVFPLRRQRVILGHHGPAVA